MYTLRDMIDRIKRELGRGDDDQVREAIVSTLYEARREAHRFSERREARIETESGRAWYSTLGFPEWTAATAEEIESSIDIRSEEIEWSFDDYPTEGRMEDLLQADFVKIRRTAGDEWELARIPYERFAVREACAASSAIPTAYTIYSQQIGLWPVPDGSYEVFISGLWRPTVPKVGYGDTSADGSMNTFFIQAEELIRNGAKRRYCEAVLDMPGAADFAMLEQAARTRLRSENTHRNDDTIRPWGVY